MPYDLFPKISAPANPPANTCVVYFDTSANALVALDENGNKVTIAPITVADYRFLKLTFITQTGGSTYTPPAAAKALYVECIGGGGGGAGTNGGSTSGNCCISAGGGGGAYSAKWYTSIAGSYSVSVGTGGGGGAVSGNGTNGAVTWFNASNDLAADFGLGSTQAIANGSSISYQLGAAGGKAANGFGDLKIPGFASKPSWRSTGGVGYSSGGAPGPFGGGTIDKSSNGAGASAVATDYGAGGGGGFATGAGGGTGFAGGSGAQGLIRVWEFA